MYRIVETDDFYPISVLCNTSGLEVEVATKAPKNTLKMWRCENTETGELLAAAVIQFKNGCYVLENLAVKECCRKTGLGKEMLDVVEEEFRKLGAEEIWGCAKVPEYYKQYGWRETDRADAPEISNCQSCKQFGQTCFPRIIKKDL